MSDELKEERKKLLKELLKDNDLIDDFYVAYHKKDSENILVFFEASLELLVAVVKAACVEEPKLLPLIFQERMSEIIKFFQEHAEAVSDIKTVNEIKDKSGYLNS